MKLIVVTGLSGAGKSVAMNALEDLGYYCVDNLPVGLLVSLAEELRRSGSIEEAAVGIDARSPGKMLAQFPAMIDTLRAQHIVSDLLFLEASDEVLIERFSETRRKHPLTATTVSLPEAIRHERELLAPIRAVADASVDTSRLHLHQLRELIWSRVGLRPAGRLSILLLSFGYKHGLPRDADMVFDLRCLPNPHWEPGLRSLTGRDDAVIAFLDSQPMVKEYFEGLATFLDRWIPSFEAGDRAYLTIALGCTGGHHRSVYMVEKLAAHFGQRDTPVLTRHRELS